MTSLWIGLDTAEWAIVAAGAAAVIGLLALVTSLVLGLSANAASARANEIADTPIELPTTALGEVAELLKEAQIANLAHPVTEARRQINDKLAQARILVDVEIGDGQ